MLKNFALAGVFLVCFAATTQIDLTRQVMGLLPCGNGGTGTATASANTVFAGPASGSSACPSFRALVAADTASLPLPNTQRFSYAVQDTYFGDTLAETSGSNNTVVVSATSQMRFRVLATTGTSGTSASAAGNLIYVTGRHIDSTGYFAVNSTTSERVWIALTDQSVATMVASDAPSGNYAGFRFSTNASDVNWQCVTSTGASQQITDSGIAPDASNFHTFETMFDDANSQIIFYIDGASVCTNGSTLPAGSTPLRFVNAITTLTASPRQLWESWHLILSDF